MQYIVCISLLNRANDVKQLKTRRYYIPEGIIKNYNFIINGENVYDQPIHSDMKRHEKIRKLPTGQGED